MIWFLNYAKMAPDAEQYAKYSISRPKIQYIETSFLLSYLKSSFEIELRFQTRAFFNLQECKLTVLY